MSFHPPDLLDRFREEAAPSAGFSPGHGTVLALSGGPDSTALLDLVLRAGADPGYVVAAHLDHSIRRDSREDALFVAEQARAAGICCRMRRRNVPAEAAGVNLEQKARSLRYEFLESVADRAGLRTVATGHHLDDQAETVMLRLIRGTGPKGLTAIPPSRPIREGSSVRLIRPLLPFTREEIVAYLAWRGLPYRTDPTNLDGSNARSRLRAGLLPALAREVPDLAARLAALADTARDLPEASGLREEIRTLIPASGPVINRATLARIEGIVEAGRGSADLGGGWRALLERGSLVVLPPDEEAPSVPRTLPVPGRVELPDGSLLVAEQAPHGDVERDDRWTEVVDADAVPGILEVRPAAEDGAFRPLGLGRETTVLRFLKGQGVPERERRTVPVLWAGGRPIWVVGYRIDERAAVRETTAARLRIRRTSPRRPSRP